jgi:hypothetical protein
MPLPISNADRLTPTTFFGTRLSITAITRQFDTVDKLNPGKISPEYVVYSLRIFLDPEGNRGRIETIVVEYDQGIGMQKVNRPERLEHLEAVEHVGPTLGDEGGIDLFSESHMAGDAPPALSHTVDLAFLDVEARFHE